MFNIGDKVKEKTGSVEWTIVEEDLNNTRYRLESDLGGGNLASQWVNFHNMSSNWVKIQPIPLAQQWSISQTTSNSDQADWFGNWDLPKGNSDETRRNECYHDWSKYVGLNQTYEFCTKCDEKRKWEP